MARAKYLADTSEFTRVNNPNVAAVIGPLIAEGNIALCAPVAFEFGFTARSGNDHDAIMARIDAFESAHFELVSDLTGQLNQWIVEPGTAD